MSYSVPDEEALKIKWHVDRLNADNDSKLVTRAKKKAFKDFLRSGGKKQKDAKRISMAKFKGVVKCLGHTGYTEGQSKEIVGLINLGTKKQKRKMVKFLMKIAGGYQLPPRIHFVEVNLEGVDLRGITDLSYIRMTDSNLKKANLQGVLLSDAKIQNTDLSGASLSEAYLVGTTFERCNLENTNLNMANLVDAVVIGCDISGCNIGDAIWGRHTKFIEKVDGRVRVTSLSEDSKLGTPLFKMEESVQRGTCI